jgi:hypothetical protein
MRAYLESAFWPAQRPVVALGLVDDRNVGIRCRSKCDEARTKNITANIAIGKGKAISIRRTGIVFFKTVFAEQNLSMARSGFRLRAETNGVCGK